jgi:probable DNA metabolism protein
MNLETKLCILADAAKYDASCASSGSRRANAGGQLGNAALSGICHTYTEDGRCVSLLKVLYTNYCIYDCAYCINRIGNDIRRAAFTPAELVSLTLNFYRRNYIEGLFLSSGVTLSPDDTMAQLIRVVRDLRGQRFNGYIHLKCVPFTSRELVIEAGRYADRLSVNIELPSDASLRKLTEKKTHESVLQPMDVIRETITENREDRKRLRKTPTFAPAGQSTQLLVGASPESDYDILHLADGLYKHRALKRVYYSGFIPVNMNDRRIPNINKPPLIRENRLYQADWLMRLYGYSVQDIISRESPNLSLEIDPKQAFALKHLEIFPVNINADDYHKILKVPGIGFRSAKRIISYRKQGTIRYEHLKQMGVVLKRALPFIECPGRPAGQDNALSLSPTALPTIPKASIAVPAAGDSTLILLTDGSFEGLLSAIFYAYKKLLNPDKIRARNGHQPGLFERQIEIETDITNSDRVWRGLKQHLGRHMCRQIYLAHLTKNEEINTLIYRYVRATMPPKPESFQEQGTTAAIEIERLSHKVSLEAHRMKGFTRFSKIGQNFYVAQINPRYDVLPLIRRHFESRYADQQWIIYDTARGYGIFYDMASSSEVQLPADNFSVLTTSDKLKDQEYQNLWKQYFESVNISQRNNPRAHLRLLPRRYWKYLPEKS